MIGADYIDSELPSIRATFRETRATVESSAYAVKHFMQRRELSQLYLGYWEETSGSHATRGLAARYAGVGNGELHLRFWKEPPEMLLVAASNVRTLAAAAAETFRLEGNRSAMVEALRVRDAVPGDIADRVRSEPEPEPEIGVISCPACLTPMVDEGDDSGGADARLVCPACGQVALAV